MTTLGLIRRVYRRTTSTLQLLGTIALILAIAGLLPTGQVAQARPLFAPAASGALSIPAEIMIGEDLSFTASFDNTGADPGYGPFIDLILPVIGVDGAGAETDDGLDFVSASYLGVPVTSTEFTFPDSGDGTGCVLHPYAVDSSGAAVQVCDTAGNKLVVLQLPFGSFVPDQPQVDVTVNATLSNLADLSQPLTLKVRGGYQFGADELHNPASDPSILGSWTNSTTTPTLLKLRKVYHGPEDETATGPNYPRQYTLHVDIADGQTLTTLDVSDFLPDNLAYLSLISTSPAGGAAIQTPTVGVPANSPNNDLVIRFPSVTGTTGDSDASVTFEYFVPKDDANSDVIIDPVSGDDVTSIDDARAEGDWDPIDSRDPNDHPVSDVTTNDHTLTDKSIAIQKGVANVTDGSNSPDDVLEYTLEIQVSDYFAFENIISVDTFSDGQHFDPTYTPRLTVNGNGFILAAAAFNPANYTVDTTEIGNDLDPDTDGSTTITFRISDEIITRGQATGRMVGGCILASGSAADCSAQNDGATTATITFRTKILDEFTDTYPSGDQSVDQGDVLSNDVIVAGDVLVNTTLLPTSQPEDDDSHAGIILAKGNLTKTIYAINDVVCDPQPCDRARIAPGETLTYRIHYTLPNSDFENLQFFDYLPLPVFLATEVTAFDSVTSATAPAAGRAKYGPADTYHSLAGAVTPTVASNAAQNRLTFTYGDYDNPSHPPSVIDLLFTVTATDRPFADGLFLTNQVRAYEGTTNAGDQVADDIIQVLLTQPVLNLRKGIIATDKTGAAFTPATVLPAGVTVSAPGSAACSRFSAGLPITSANLPGTMNSNLSGVDAGDLVTFAIVIENTGRSAKGAFDVRLRDSLPAGFVIPSGGAGLNLCVTDGTGDAIAYTTLGSGLFDPSGGIELTDPGPTDPPAGAIDTGRDLSDALVTTGRNLAIVTFDLQLDSSVQPRQGLTNTATVYNYAGDEGGPDHTTTNLTDTATVTGASPVIDKTLLSTNQGHTLNNDVAIGEIVTYRVTVDIPEGVSSSVQLIDILGSGLAFVDCVNISASPGLSTSLAGGFTDACLDGDTAPANPLITSSGGVATFDLGTITNSNRDDGVTESIIFDYTVVVLNTAGNDRGVARSNAASYRWDNGAPQSITDSAPVTIVEPTLQISITPTPTSGDAGDLITFELVIQHTGSSNADAFNVALSDVLPAGLTYIDGTLQLVTGLVPDSLTGGATVSAGWNVFPDGSTSTLQFQAELDGTVQPRQTITNPASITWTSLPGDVTSQQSTYNTVSTERTGDTGNPGGVQNDYRASANAPVTVPQPVLNKVLHATNQAHTAGGDVAIGEILTYRVTVDIPEGTSNSVQLVDTLNTGLAFVDCVSVSGSAGLSTSLAGGFGDACAAPANPVITNSGRTITFSLGTLTNTNRDNGVTETLTIDYTVVVLNAAGNDRGVSRSNSAVYSWNNGSPQSLTDTTPVTIVEPTLTIGMTADPTHGDYGDEITFEIVIQHTGSSNTDAFNLALSDVLPAGLAYVSGPVHMSGLAPTSSSGGATVSAAWNSFPLGSTSTLRFVARLTSAVQPGQTLTNPASITWTSLPGDVTSPQSTYSPVSTERTGNTGNPGGVQNDYSTNASANVTVDLPTLTKSITATSEANTSGTNVVIGEIITYRVVVDIPEGTSNSVRLVDTLASGLAFGDCLGVNPSSGDLSTTLAGGFSAACSDGLSAPSNPIISNSGRTITYELGDITNTNQDNGETETLTFDYTVVVLNQAGNDRGVTRSNSAVYEWNNGSVQTLSGSTTVTIVEPALQISKSPNPSWVTDPTAPIEITLVVRHTASSNGTALDVAVSDALPAELSYVPASLVHVSGLAPTSSSGGSTVSASWDTFPLGQTSTLRFQVTLNTAVIDPGEATSNTATVTWTSLLGNFTTAQSTYDALSTERTGNTGDPGGAENDYTHTSQTCFIFYPAAAIGDTVWLDEDADAKQDAGEAGIPNVKVVLYGPGTDLTLGTGDDVTVSTTRTDLEGRYLFRNLTPGSYRVQIDTTTLAAGLVANPTFNRDATLDHYTDVTITTGQELVDADFGYNWAATLDVLNNTGLGAIGDRVWNDADRDGREDPGEAGFYNVSLTLRYDSDADGFIDADYGTTTTDYAGNYIFDNLPAGIYEVVVNPPVGYTQSGDPDQWGAACTVCDHRSGGIILAPGDVWVNADFGYDQTSNNGSTIGDRVYFDTNANSAEATPDYGIPFVTVALIRDLDNDGVWDDGEPIIATDITNPLSLSSPTYSFPGLPAGRYIIWMNDTLNALAGLKNTAGTGGMRTINIAANTTNNNQDFGVTSQLQTGSLNLIGDLIAYDRDGANDVDLNEGIEGIRIDLYDSTGTVFLATTYTDENGRYYFGGLPDGTYVVRVNTTSLPAGVSITRDPQAPNDHQAMVTLNSAGRINVGMDFAYRDTSNPNTVGGTLWRDVDGDGLLDGAETGRFATSYTLLLLDANGNILGTINTDGSGNYSFPRLPDGIFSVDVTDWENLLHGYWHSLGLQGETDNNNSKADPYIIELLNGENRQTVDFGYYREIAALGNFVWHDQNGDGIQDAGELGIPNVKVELTISYPGGAGTTVVATITDGNGYYNFTNLLVDENFDGVDTPEPTYSIRVYPPAGFLPSPQNRTTEDYDSDDSAGQTATVTEGVSDTTYDFGFYRTGVIGDRVWLDEDADGVQDAGEAGIPNVEVTLNGTDGGGIPVTRTTRTDSEGNYLFTGLAPGSYTASVTPATLPAGLAINQTGDPDATFDHATTIALASGQSILTADFGYNWSAANDVTNNTDQGAIGDRVWIDADGDGIQDPGEAGLGGVSVALWHDSDNDGSIDTLFASTLTDAAGNYIFDDLNAGIYRVVVTPPGGYTQTGDPDRLGAACTTCDHQTTSPVVLAPGDVFVNVDFGYRLTSGGNTIGNQIFLDSNADGNLDGGEPGIPGVSVALEDGSGVIIATTLTDANGQYSFPGLPDGTYTVWVNDTADVLGDLAQTSTPDNAADGGQVCGACTGRNTVTVSGSGNSFQDFGYTPIGHTSGTGLIGDTVFMDRDAGNDYDPGEGLQGVTVELYNAAGTILLATTTTDANGQYSFGGLAAGAYRVQVNTSSLPAGLTNTVDPDTASPGDSRSNVTLAAGEINLAQDFGYLDQSSPNSVAGTLWINSDADGTLDATETGRWTGVTLALRDANGNLLATTTTDSNGDWSFTNLPDGTFQVDVTDTANRLNGAWHTLGAQGEADDNQSKADPYTITLSGGEDRATVDFGYYRSPASLGNYVWHDQDRDGVQDGTEPAMDGVPVTLTIGWPNGSSTLLQTTTAGGGLYRFDNLLLDENFDGAGSGEPVHTLRAATPAGYRPSPSDQTGEALDSDNPYGQVATLTKGAFDDTYDFGFHQPPASLGDRVWLDENADGIQDAGEAGLPNVKVELLDGSSTVIAATYTDAEGAYLFANLDPGAYTVRIDPTSLPAGLAANQTGDPDASFDHQTAVTLVAGQEWRTADFGYDWSSANAVTNNTGQGAIGDRVWIDANGDGRQDPGEAGLGGVSVALWHDANNDGIIDTLLASTTTNSAGNYIFDDRNAGIYRVVVTPPGGYTQTGDPDRLGAACTTCDHQTTSPVVLAPGDVFVNADFGYQPSGSSSTIGDQIYFDANADGSFNGSDWGIPGVSVALILDNDNDNTWDAGEPVIATDLTDSSGLYSFPGLPAGSYLVWVNDTANVLAALKQTGDPDGGLDSLSAVDVDGTADNLLQDHGYTAATHSTTTGLIGDTVFLDRDAGSDFDLGERLQGVRVELYRGAELLAATTSDQNGQYTFGGLAAGAYQVRVDLSTLPAGLTNTIDPDTASPGDSQSALVLAAGEINRLQDFGYQALAAPNTLAGTLWLDSNADGYLDGAETGRWNGVTLSLWDASGNLFATTTTDSSGNFSFTGLPDGAYRVDVTNTGHQLNGTWKTSGTAGVDNHSQADPYLVNLAGGVPDTTADFGYYRSLAGLGDRTWRDNNGEGTQNGGEPDLDGVTLTLTITWPGPGGGSTLLQTTTASGGLYSFTNLLLDEGFDGIGAGEPQFAITAGSLSGYTFSPIDQGGDDAADSDNHAGQPAFPVKGATDNSYDFGFIPSNASVGDLVWLDLNGDGLQTGGEPGAADVQVELYTGAGVLVSTTQTDNNGAYLFDSLPPGNYYIKFSLPGGYLFSLQDQGGDEALDSDAQSESGQTATFALAVSQNRTNVDSGLLQATSIIGDRIWLDENADGVQDTGEAGIPNVEVTLSGTDGGGNPVSQTTHSDAEGNYLFTGLPPGSYTVTVNPLSLPTGLAANQTGDPDGVFNHATSVTLTSGQNVLTADFGYDWSPASDVTNNTGLSAIGDRVWIDADGNGRQDPGEAGLSGITVRLLVDSNGDGLFGGTGDAAAQTTTTDATGSYIFDNLAAGGYIVQVVSSSLPGGYTQTGDPDGAIDHQTTHPVVLAPGDVFINADFGYQPASSSTIGDLIYFDANANGSFDGSDRGIPGVSVALILDSNNNNAWDAGEPVIATDLTDSDGLYSFPGLPAGNYLVWVNDTANVLSGLSQTYDPDGGLNRLSAVDVDGAANDLLQDHGFAPAGHAPGDGLIGDTVFLDRDANGIFASGEGLQGVTVNLYNAAGSVRLATTTTDANGQYAFGDLAAGTYQVRVDTSSLPAGMTNTVDPDGGGNSRSSVTLAAGEINLAQDFGYRDLTNLNSLAGTLWTDTDADGALDGAETGRWAGVTLALRDAIGNLLATTTTDSNGDWSFTNLPDGTFQVDVTDTANLLNGAWHTLGAQGETDDHQSKADPYTITLSGGENRTTVDFGYYRDPASLGDRVWHDQDGDGIQNGGETGIPNALVSLIITYPDSTVSVISTRTDGSGLYTFANLLLDEDFNGDGAGEPTFVVRFSPPNGYPTASPVGLGGDSTIDSNGALATAAPRQGQTDNTIDSGFLAAVATIGDLVWLDVDADGVYDIGEPGLPNVEVHLYDPGPDGVAGGGNDVLIATTYTDATGQYQFSAPAGSYFVDVASGLPAGLTTSPGVSDPTAVFTASAGSSYLDKDFGYRSSPASAIVGDYLWSDVNNNGRQDPGEAGIGGVTVRLLADNDGDGDFGDVIATTTTAADGRYFFSGVTPGKYIVEVTDTGNILSGYAPTSGPHSPGSRFSTPFSVIAGSAYLEADFGYYQAGLGRIGDLVWLDKNLDGIAGAEEPGLGGVTVDLYRDSDGDGFRDPGEPAIATTTTAADGSYTFSGLNLNDGDGDADYIVQVSDRDGVLTGLTPTTASPLAVALSAGMPQVLTADFGFDDPIVGDFVWHDLDNDGIQDPGEPGLGSVLVNLYNDANTNGAIDAGDTLIRSMLTTSDGYYYFGELPFQSFIIKLADNNFAAGGNLNGFSPAPQNAGSDDQVDSDGNLNHEISLTPLAAKEFDYDFGFTASGGHTLGDRVWADLNADGRQDAGETGLAGVSLDLYRDLNANGRLDAGDALLSRTTTAGDGLYAFHNLPDSSYLVTVTDRAQVLAGYRLTSGLDVLAVTLAGSDVLIADFGYARTPQTGWIGDFIWLDANGNGAQDQAETGLAGVRVRLYGPGPNGVRGDGDDVLLATTTTDAAGRYGFAGLLSGRYYVDVDENSLPVSGLAVTSATSYPDILIALGPGETYPDADFGYSLTTGSLLGDRVWYDADRDGAQDPGEVGIAGVLVTISGPGLGAPLQVTTDANGIWLASVTGGGNYTVTVTPPAGYNATPTNGAISRTLQVDAGQDVLYADFGFDAPAGLTATLGDRVFLDANANGSDDLGEAGLPGVTLNLVGPGGDGAFGTADDKILATTSTDAAGSYTFSGLPTGNYRVDVTDLDQVLKGLVLSAGTDPTATIALSGGADYQDADFGYAPAGATIGNLVWHDLNGNGVRDAGEPGMQGVTLNLYADSNGDNSLTPGVDNLVRTAVTDHSGLYEFKNLPAGSYFVDVTDTSGVLGGFSLTAGTPGSDNNSQADPYRVTLVAGSPGNYTADFGYRAGGTPYVLRGIVFEDLDNDGSYDTGENRIPRVPVQLHRDLNGDGILDADDPLIGSTESATDGSYSFSDLPTSTHYIVAVSATVSYLNGFFQTTQQETPMIGVQPAFINGADSTGNDFGFHAPGGAQTTPVTLSFFQATRQGQNVYFEWSTETETGNLGFNLYALGETGWQKLNPELIPSAVIDSLDRQDYNFTALNLESDLFYIEDLSVLGKTQARGPFRLGEAYGLRQAVELIDWASIRLELEARAAERLAIRRAEAVQTAAAPAKDSDSVTGDRATDEAGQATDKGPTPATAAIAYPPLELRVNSTGLYRVSYEALRDAGLDLTGLSNGNLALVNRGQPVPIRVWSSGKFGPGAWIEFYGEALDTLYTSTNVYYLYADKKLASRVTVDLNKAPTNVPIEPYYLEAAKVERERAYSNYAANGDPWFDSNLSVSTKPGSWSFSISVDNYKVNAAPASLFVGLWGGTDYPQDPDHHLVTAFNSQTVADHRFDGIVDFTYSVDLPAGLLKEGANELKLTLPADTGAEQDVLRLDRYSITYPRAFVARDGLLSFTSAGRLFQVEGLPTANVVIYRLDGQGVSLVSKFNVSAANGAYRVRFGGTGQPATYWVTVVERLLQPAGMQPARPAEDLTSSQADYLIIAHPNFIAGLQPLVDARQAQGLSVKVVDVEAVYAQFGHGLFDPQGIKDYIRYAAQNMGTRYVLLVGGDTYDYRNYLGTGAVSFLPSIYAATSKLATFTAADPLYADTDGDGLPNLAIGRFPVRKVADLNVVVAKTLAYASKDYGRSAVFSADKQEGSFAYANISEGFIGRMGAGWAYQRSYLDEYDVATARSLITNAINDGVALTNYIGHSGTSVWTFLGLYSYTDVNALTNAGRPTVVVQWGCWNTYYTSSSYNTMAASFLLGGDRGAAAVLGATTLSEVASDEAFGNLLMPYLVQPGMSLGDALLAAKAELALTNPDMLDVLLGFTLLGDPTLVIEP